MRIADDRENATLIVNMLRMMCHTGDYYISHEQHECRSLGDYASSYNIRLMERIIGRKLDITDNNY